MSRTKLSSPTAAGQPDAPATGLKRRGAAFWAVIGLLALAGGLWLASFIHRAIVFEETDDAYISGHIHIVSPRLDGSVTHVLVSENQVVKAGQILAQLDPLGPQIELQKSRAALEAAGAELLQAETAVDQAKAENAQAQAQVAVAAAQVQQANAQLQLANANRERDERLFHADTRTVSQAEADITENAAAASQAGVTSAAASLAAAKAKAEVSASAIAAAQAHVASARARVETERQGVRDAERRLSYAAIPAPEDGRIGDKNVEVGNRVQVGQALFALVGRDYWITANFKETQLRKMQPGQRAEITIDALGGHAFAGKVESIAPATGAVFSLLPPDNATGNFTKVVQRVPAKIVFDPGSIAGFEDRLRPGLSAVVSVRIK